MEFTEAVLWVLVTILWIKVFFLMPSNPGQDERHDRRH